MNMVNPSDAALAVSIDGGVLARAIRKLGATHVLCIPDTNLRTAIAALQSDYGSDFILASTEDEAVGITAGLYMTGKKPLMVIQNNGLFAMVNTLKAISLDAQVPTFLVIGQYGRNTNLPVEANRLRSVRLLEPTLATWGVPFVRVDSGQDVDRMQAMWDAAYHARGPAAAIIGAPTS